MQLTNLHNTFTTEQTAKNFETTVQSLGYSKRNHADELIEGIHYFKTYEQTKGGKQEVIRWTLKGVVVLGFFIRSPKAKAFRIWASNELEKQLLAQAQELQETKQRAVKGAQKIAELNAVLINQAKHHNRQIMGYKSQLAQHNKRINILEYELSKSQDFKKQGKNRRENAVHYLARINKEIERIYTANGALMSYILGDNSFIQNNEILRG